MALTDTAAASRGLDISTPHWVSPARDSILYVGDALEVLATIPPETVDCVWTDPPYKLSNGGITCVAGRMVSVDKGEWDRSEGLEVDHQFNHDWVAACKRVLKPTGTIWVSGTLHLYPSVGMALLENGFRLLNDIIWEKPNPPPNMGRRTFTHSTEVVLWASKAEKGSRHKYTFNYDLMREENGGKQMKTVWGFRTPGREEKRFGKHPTQKPVSLIARCLRASTDPDGLVLDPFAGAGSTGVAALQEGRKFIGIEAVAEYADIAQQRLESVLLPPPPPPIIQEMLRISKILTQSTRRKSLITGRDCSKKESIEIWLGAILGQATLWSRWYCPHWRWEGTRSGAV